MEGLLSLVFQFLQVVLFPVIATYLVMWLKQKGVHEMIKSKEDLVLDAVQFAEQVYGHLDGREKYEVALVWASNRFKQYGFKVDPEEIEGLIEAMVNEIQSAWIDEIYEIED